MSIKDKQAIARELRNNMTFEEIKLYKCFFKADNIHVRRQYIIEPYVVDFCVVEKKLIIELDGNDHFSYYGRQHDKIRDDYLRSKGYRVLRFENSLVRDNFEKVCNKIEKYL